MAEIFIVQCDFTGKITHPSSVTNFRALQVSHTQNVKTRQCVKQHKNFEVWNGTTWRGCASQKCSNLIDRKGFDFLWNKLEKSPQFRQFTCQNALFHKTQSVVLSWFLVEPLPVLVSRIPIKIENEMNITNFWIRNMARILPSENYVKQKFACQNTLLPVKLPWSLSSFVPY